MNDKIQEDNQANDSYISYISYIVPGLVGHIVGYVVELASNATLRKILPDSNYKWTFYFVSKILHEGVENVISSGGVMNLMNLEGLVDSIINALKPVREEPVKFIVAASCSWVAEAVLTQHTHHGHDHGHHGHGEHEDCYDHSVKGIGLAAFASVAGSTVCISLYDYFIN